MQTPHWNRHILDVNLPCLHHHLYTPNIYYHGFHTAMILTRNSLYSSKHCKGLISKERTVVITLSPTWKQWSERRVEGLTGNSVIATVTQYPEIDWCSVL